MRVRFAEFTFDTGRRLLFRGPVPVELSPKAFQLLGLLLARRPEAISKTELLAALWPSTFVSEGNLASLVNEIRHALGEKGREASSIRTLHGFGYAFEGEAMGIPDAGASPQRHRLLWGHQEIGLSEGENVIGRMPDAPVWIGHPSVSRRHARILITGDRAEIEDLESKNGKWKSGAKVTGLISLSDGDEIRVGRVRLNYRNSVADPSAETETDASSASG